MWSWLLSTTAMAALMTSCRPQLLAGSLLGRRPLLVPPQCLLPPETGPCRARIPSMFFNATLGACDCFNYGGCRGNANRFPDMLSCMATCGVSWWQQRASPRCQNTEASYYPRLSPTPPPKMCMGPPETGLCRAKFPSIYYNTTTGTCDCFYYGGCGGNDNRFSDVMSCMKSCNVTADRQVYTESCRIVFARPRINAIVGNAGSATVEGGQEGRAGGDDGDGKGY